VALFALYYSSVWQLVSLFTLPHNGLVLGEDRTKQSVYRELMFRKLLDLYIFGQKKEEKRRRNQTIFEYSSAAAATVLGTSPHFPALSIHSLS
jgi:hypothetical protein